MQKPNLLKTIRAPFLSSILSPLLAGTLLAVLSGAPFHLFNFILVLIMGMGLHAATNVYNDIYDTLQGTDRINEHRNDFSGGSGLLVENPDMISYMRKVARGGLMVALAATFVLSFVIRPSLLPLLWILYLLSAFFSKYYTAAPVKLAYRGWGEIAVWFAFGPMATLVAAVSQNVAAHPYILFALPITGLSTASILLVGEIIDETADRDSGKMTIVARTGAKTGRWVYMGIQLILILNTALLCGILGWPGLIALIGLVPYFLIFPKAVEIITRHYQDMDLLKKAAGLNVKIHLLFAVLFNLGLWLAVMLA